MPKGAKPTTLVQVLALVGGGLPARVSANASVISAIAVMQKNDFQELLLDSTTQGRESPKIFSGYSIISKLIATQASNYGYLLESRCVDSSLAVGTISGDSDLLSLFHVFESTTFGFAIVHDASGKILGKISVKDLLVLFDRGLLSSKLLIDDVASSPVFSMSRGTKIVECLRQLESRKFRKVQLTGTNFIVSDKQILSYIFDDKRLQQISKRPQHLLDDTLEDLQAIQAPQIDGSKSVSGAAKILAEKGHDFLLSERGIVTPWDLTIKPWRLGGLRVS